MSILHLVTPEPADVMVHDRMARIAALTTEHLGQPVKLLPHDFAEFAKVVSDRSPWRPPATDEAAIVLLPSRPGLDLTGLIDALCERQIPAVVLGNEESLSDRRLRSAGLATLSLGVSDVHAAIALCTLLQRQPLVASLARELAISHRTSGGLRGEMDRLHEELNLAACVQRDFLPKHAPSVAGLDFGVLFRPCGYVSGDIYSIQPLDDRHTGFFIADAVGHGVPAALLTVVLANSLMTRDEHGQIVAPADVLLRLNRALCEQQFAASRFATAVYGVIDTLTLQVTLAGAGHPPPLLIGRDSVEKIETEGPLLGVFPEAEFTQATAMLEPGQTLLLYTDGFETACPGTEAVGRDIRRANDNYVHHAVRMVRAHAGTASPAMTMIDELRDLLDTQSGSLHQVDDITALAISPVKPAQAAAHLVSKAA